MEKKQITAKWYEVKVQYEKAMEDGLEKKVTETYCFDALSFTEAEEAAISQLDWITDPDITGIAIAKYREVFLDDDAKADKWYKVTVKIITIDEKTGKEKKQPVVHLVQAGSTETAEKYVREVYDQGMQSYIITDINESKVLEVYPHVQGKEDEV